MIKNLRRSILSLAVASVCLIPLHAKDLKWEKKLLTIDSNEGCALGDVNGDGTLDIIAGRNWYCGKDLAPRPVRTIEDNKGYVDSNGDYLWDFNNDGHLDIFAHSFFDTKVYWYENPGPESLKLGKMWPKHLLKDTGYTRNEGQILHDLDRDGRPEFIVSSWFQMNHLVFWRFSEEEREIDVVVNKKKTIKKKMTVPSLSETKVSHMKNGHGLGAGDLNGDGLEDIIFQHGWFEQPKSNAFEQTWKHHSDWDRKASLPMIIEDLNEDGRNDIIWGMAHDYGLYWEEQLEPSADGKLQWKKHTIDESFSQAHSLAWADLDGDGQKDLITGKRFYAHNGKDPGGNENPCLYYYTFDKKSKTFKKHIIDEENVGCGLHLATGDIDKNGHLDIAVAGKSGTFVLFNQGF